MTALRDRLLAAVAGQLGRPHGVLGLFVARALNRGNERAIAAAVDAAEVRPGATAADVGFGGGIGLRMLLDRVGDTGTVHGVEIADDMLRRAKSRFSADLRSGRLRLQPGSMTALPLDDASLDAVITLNTVYFIDDLGAAVAELARAVRPGGRVVVGIGDPDAMRHAPFTQYGFTLRPVADVAAALAEAGMTVEHRAMDDKPIPRHLFIAQHRT
ncbi:methyltransferase domain-containing protein [Mycobacterium sp. B14F4]|uniref:class I SAM-dependent methyltransferase n=1 Tax=Mycobacterium sp. B14F4 TaxID=3153565 RepID=UPI00325E6852